MGRRSQRLDWLQTIRTNKESSRNEALTWKICNPQQWTQHSMNEPPKPPWDRVGQIKKIEVRLSIRTCVPNLGAVRREFFLTIDNLLNPPRVGWVKNIFC